MAHRQFGTTAIGLGAHLTVYFVATCVLAAAPAPDNRPAACRSNCPSDEGSVVATDGPDTRSIWQRQYDQLAGTPGHAHDIGLLAYPTVAYSPETQWEFGINTLYVYYANNDEKNRLSQLNAFTFVTQAGQYGLWINHALYSDKNEWFFYGNFKFQSFPLQFYGLGPHSTAEPKAITDGLYVLIKERALRRIWGSLYLGIQLELQSLTNVDFTTTPGNESLARPLGADGGTNLGAGFGIVYDNCHNALNVRRGYLGEVSLTFWPDATSTYPMAAVFTDGRAFYPVTETQVLALQINGTFKLGDVPFNELPGLGGHEIMRGFYSGRYRDRNAIAAQLEYRFLPFRPGWRIGGALFGAVGSVAPDLRFRKLVFAVGAGLRVLLFPLKDVFVRLDYAVTSEGSGTYIFIGESF